MKKTIFRPFVSAIMVILLTTINLKGQVRTPTLYVTGTVLSDEKMLVSVLGTKYIEGNVVSAELNGKKTETKTDNKGHAILDFSAIAGQFGSGVAIIKSFDKNGNLLSTATSNVQQGTPAVARPLIEQLPKNIPNNEVVTIPGQNLGAEAKLTCGDKVQETLSASDKEMIVFTNTKTGEQPAYVTTPNGVSESQTVNVYSLDFSLSKSSIKPRQNVQAMVHYESIPVGTKLIFTNITPQTITMTIPGAQNAANECVYTVPEKNGSLPVNITGIIKGNFKVGLDFDFKNEMNTPKDSNNVKAPQEKNNPPAPALIKVPLLINVLKGTAVDKADLNNMEKIEKSTVEKYLKEAMEKANTIFKQCNIEIQLDTKNIDWDAKDPDGKEDGNMDADMSGDQAKDINEKAKKELKEKNGKGKDVKGFKIYIVNKILNKPASEAGFGFWFPEPLSSGFSILEAGQSLNDGRILAHEIAHGLGCLDHVKDIENLLYEKGNVSNSNTKLTEDQCKQLREMAAKRQ